MLSYAFHLATSTPRPAHGFHPLTSSPRMRQPTDGRMAANDVRVAERAQKGERRDVRSGAGPDMRSTRPRAALTAEQIWPLKDSASLTKSS